MVNCCLSCFCFLTVGVVLLAALIPLIPMQQWHDGIPDFGVGEIDEFCKDRNQWYYRTYDGSCNWLAKGQGKIGVAGGPFMRDREAHYKPGTYDEPREGPNVRELSNIFFKNRLTKYWDHTPYLVAYVEFLVHEWMYSLSGTEPEDRMEIPIPKCDEDFDPKCEGNKTMTMTRSARVPGTGVTSPRESLNGQTIWMDVSGLYGVNKETTDKLRTFKDGKLKSTPDKDGDLLPWNDMNIHMNGWGKLFAAGDPRANQDFLLMAITNLLLLEHNRLCDVLLKRYPDKDWDDEKLFLTAKTVLSAKFSALGASYLQSYFTDNKDTNPGLFMWESWFGEHWFNFIGFVKYPYRRFLNQETQTPYFMPVEFSIGYRWHDILPSHMALADDRNNVYKWIDLTETAFNATAFAEYGLADVLRGMAVTQIPDFHSGTQDNVRSVSWNMGQPEIHHYFDLAAWSIAHERERGVPTYNEYMRGYTGKVPSPPKKTFEEFSSNPYFVQELKRLYKTPDDVDLSVGLELDELKWPSTHVPRSMLLTSFYTLSLLASQDRFALQYTMMQCFVEGRPWDCKPTNILQELMWEPVKLPWGLDKYFPNARWWSDFWWEELDLSNTGNNLFHRLVVENTPVKCLQKNPFLAANQVTNPVVCHNEESIFPKV